MPPHKQPLSLFSLSMKKVVQVIHSAAANITDISEEHEAKEAIDTVQGLLTDHIGPALWDSLFDRSQVILSSDVPASFSNKTHQIICSILIREYSRICIIRNLLDVDFNYFPQLQLKNIVKLQISPLSYEVDFNILQVIGNKCHNLEHFTFKTSDIVRDVQLLASCTKLRSLFIMSNQIGENAALDRQTAAQLMLDLFPNFEYHQDSQSMGNAVSSLTKNRPLKLRTIGKYNCSVTDVKKIISMCPNLQHLDIMFAFNTDLIQIFEALLESSLNLRELAVYSDIFGTDELRSFEQFIKGKGEHLKEFIFFLAGNVMPPFVVVHAIAKSCKNLTHLHLDSRRMGPNPDYLQMPVNDEDLIVDRGGYVLRELKSLRCNCMNVHQIKIISPILEYSPISTLSITVSGSAAVDELLRAMNCIQMETLSKVELMTNSVVRVNVLLSFYKNFPKLTQVDIYQVPDIDPETLEYLNKIKKEAEENNLEFKIDIFKAALI